MRLPKARAALPVLAALLLIAARGVGAAVMANEPVAARIVMKGFTFAPASLIVKSGTTVMWTNEDDEPHTVVSESGLFHSDALDTDGTFAFRFDHPGTYRFLCSIHPQMVGTIVVQ